MEYHVLLNIDTEPVDIIIVNQQEVEIAGIHPNTDYTVKVRAVVDGTQRSDPDTVLITAGRCHFPYITWYNKFLS